MCKPPNRRFPIGVFIMLRFHYAPIGKIWHKQQLSAERSCCAAWLREFYGACMKTKNAYLHS